MTKFSKNKYGCISKSLDKFLSFTNDLERKKEYGTVNAAKYYERIVKGINASFTDHRKAIEKLPAEYLKKIKFEQYYESITNKELYRRWSDQPPDKFLEEVLANITKLINYLKIHPKIKNLAQKDIEKIHDWIYLFQIMQKRGIKNL